MQQSLGRLKMFQDLGKNDAIKFARRKIAHHAVNKMKGRRPRFPAFNRFLMRINCGYLVPGDCQRDCQLRSIAASEVEDAKFAAFPAGKFPHQRIIHKAKTLTVAP